MNDTAKADNQDELLRCRRVREEFGSQFKSLDELFACLDKMPTKGKKPIAKARRCKVIRATNTSRTRTGHSLRKAVG